MSQNSPPNHPAPFPPPPPPPKVFSWVLALSLVLNGLMVGAAAVVLGLFWLLQPVWSGLVPTSQLNERPRPGSGQGKPKIAVLQISGMLIEGALDYTYRQIEQAAADPEVQAVVLRINSPGGTMTSSDELHRRISLLATGDPDRKRPAKKAVVASFGALAASGAYYLAMPASNIFIDRVGVTGSIGVFASLPSVEELAKRHGFGMQTIKQGEIKDSGSPFRQLSAKERQVWQDLIDTSYLRFVEVVEKGRGQRLRKGLLEKFELNPVNAGPPDAQGKSAPYQRYLADGGIYTTARALELGLVDQIGPLDSAIQRTRELAGLDSACRVIEYEKPRAPAEWALGVQAPWGASPSAWVDAFTPRVWALSPGMEAAALLALPHRGE